MIIDLTEDLTEDEIKELIACARQIDCEYGGYEPHLVSAIQKLQDKFQNIQDNKDDH